MIRRQIKKSLSSRGLGDSLKSKNDRDLIADQIRTHFEEEAGEYDEIIRRLIPHYERMLEALTIVLPFDASQEIRVLDLGCGTGMIAHRIKAVFPKARLTCLDLAENMIRMARARLGSDVRYIQADFQNHPFDETYDAVLSSLALHHLVSDRDKIDFFVKIFRMLKPGGVFFNADVVLGSSPFMQERYMEAWKRFQRLRVSDDEIEGKWLPKYRAEDRPAKLTDQLDWLRGQGFQDVDVIWKYYNFAVYGGRKPPDGRPLTP
jgi:tRNA (cmo5U34)-methyltransferase